MFRKLIFALYFGEKDIFFTTKTTATAVCSSGGNMSNASRP